jgi:hypothetical protein
MTWPADARAFQQFLNEVTERLLKAAIAGQPPPYPLPDLTALAAEGPFTGRAAFAS